MNEKYELRILGSFDEVIALNNNCESSKKVISFLIGPVTFGLLIYTENQSRISFLKLNVKEQISDEENLKQISDDDRFGKEAFKISLLNVFKLPFILLKIICTDNNVWAIGQESIVDLKPYIQSVLEREKSDDEEDCMEVDAVEGFHYEMFDITISTHSSEKYDLHCEDIFIGCNFIDYGFIRCRKNSLLNAWQLEIIFVNSSSVKLPNLTSVTFLNIPVSLKERDAVIASSQGQKDIYDPVVLCIHHSEPESHTIKDIFGINCPPSNFLCLVGHSEGKLLCCLCDYNTQFHSSLTLQTLFDIKVPVIGIYFVKNIEELEGNECMVVVGASGHVTLFSSKVHRSFTLVPGQHPFWITTAHIKSSISKCAVVKGCLFCFSRNEALWITDLSVLLTPKEKSEELHLGLNSSNLFGVEQIIFVNENQGLFLCQTSYENMYLAVCKKKSDTDNIMSSLPLLMNDCLQQSTMMQGLLKKKALQSRLFATVSAFASLKFCADVLKEDISFTISEVNLEPRKYILVLNYKCFEKLHLDSELCHVTATVFTYFRRNFSLVTKTAPYRVDQPTLCLELTDTVLQPPFVSVFPLFVEVGLTLQLPSSWKVISCFKSISDCLPFYLRVQTFIVHELHLLQSNVLCPAQSFDHDKPKAMKIIKELAMKRPISNILQMESKMAHQFPLKFNIFFSLSSVEEMAKNSGECDPCKYIKMVLFKNNKNSVDVLEKTHHTSGKGSISIEITKNNDGLVLTLTANTFDSLIGLRIAVMDRLLILHNQSKHLTNSSTYVSVPASIYRKCEDLSKLLMNLYGKDVVIDEVTETIMQLYQDLRREVSAKLPIF